MPHIRKDPAGDLLRGLYDNQYGNAAPGISEWLDLMVSGPVD